MWLVLCACQVIRAPYLQDARHQRDTFQVELNWTPSRRGIVGNSHPPQPVPAFVLFLTSAILCAPSLTHCTICPFDTFYIVASFSHPSRQQDLRDLKRTWQLQICTSSSRSSPVSSPPLLEPSMNWDGGTSRAFCTRVNQLTM